MPGDMSDIRFDSEQIARVGRDEIYKLEKMLKRSTDEVETRYFKNALADAMEQLEGLEAFNLIIDGGASDELAE